MLAAGGIADGRQIAAALALGAAGRVVRIGLADDRGGRDAPVVKEKFLAATSSDTLRSRAKTGKPARQLRSAWTDEWDDPANPDPLAMPLQMVLVGEAERAHRPHGGSNDGSSQLINYFVGQAVGQMNEPKPATPVVFDLVDQYVDAAERVAATIADDVPCGLTPQQLRGAAIVGLGITETGKVYGRTAGRVRRRRRPPGRRRRRPDARRRRRPARVGRAVRRRRHPPRPPARAARPRHPQPGLAGRLDGRRPGAARRAGHRRRAGHDGRHRPRRRPAASRRPRSGDAYRRAAGQVATGFAGLAAVAGPRNPNSGYALAAQRHMNRFGTTSEQLGAIAVGQRAWATKNPLARFRDPITLADHQASRWVARPLHLLDCCMVSNGGIAMVVTSVERAAHLPSRRCTSGAGRRPTPATAWSAARTGASCRAPRSPARRRWRWPASPRPTSTSARSTTATRTRR